MIDTPLVPVYDRCIDIVTLYCLDMQEARDDQERRDPHDVVAKYDQYELMVGEVRPGLQQVTMKH